ncbi:MAG: hypothetical protein MOB07_18495 [Acidobacteria bacterium]|nr:hypothetical protein [Acidobacteriota bacterium]
MSGAANSDRERWTFGVRVIPGVVPRASLRTTLTYRLHPRLTAGVEVNPRADEAGGRVSPLVNWLAITETENRPALILGTSSDRIGTPKGQSFYATLSKNLKRQTGLPIAPYAGVAYSTYEHRWLPLAGLSLSFTRSISATVIFDGVKVHPLVNYSRGRHAFSFILAFANKPGFSYSISF